MVAGGGGDAGVGSVAPHLPPPHLPPPARAASSKHKHHAAIITISRSILHKHIYKWYQYTFFIAANSRAPAAAPRPAAPPQKRRARPPAPPSRGDEIQALSALGGHKRRLSSRIRLPPRLSAAFSFRRGPRAPEADGFNITINSNEIVESTCNVSSGFHFYMGFRSNPRTKPGACARARPFRAPRRSAPRADFARPSRRMQVLK